MLKSKKIIVFASGSGSNFVSIFNHIQNGGINGEVVLLVSDKRNCGAIEFAKKNDIEVLSIQNKTFNNNAEYAVFLLNKINSKKADLLVLAGYLKMIPDSVIKHYKQKILNIHPSLLPKYGGKGYYGMNVHKAVVESGDTITGASVHFVDEIYDNGPIVAQKEIVINENESAEIVSKEVLKIEHELYPYVVKAFCEDKIKWDKNIPKIIGMD